MSEHDQTQQARQIAEPTDGRDDRRKAVTNPADAPVPANPPIDHEDLERGLAKLDRVVAS